MVDYLSSQLQAPIPGQSLTTEPGARPWEKPARFTLPEEAMGYYLDQFADADRTAEMLDILESGFPVTNLIDGITMSGVMEGLHSIDVGIIIAPALYEFITTIADEEEIKYKTGLRPDERSQLVDNTLIAKAKAMDTSKSDELVKQVQTEENDRVKQALSGLMARETEAPDAPEALETTETTEEEMPI